MTDDHEHVMVVIVETSRGFEIIPFEVDPLADEDDEPPATSRTTTPTINKSLQASLRGYCRDPDVSDAELATLYTE